MSEKTQEPLKFEEAIEHLEQIIERIESGEAGLETSLVEYEKGMKLITQCRTILDTAEKKIAELTVDADGRLAVNDSESDDPSDTE